MCSYGRGGGKHGFELSNLLGYQPDSGMLAVNKGPDSIAQVAQQMPSVGHLDRARRTLPRTVCIGAGPVACHHLDPGMLA